MTNTPRLDYGTRQAPVRFGLVIERPVRDEWKRMAAASGMSSAVLFEEVTRALPRDEYGRPAFLELGDPPPRDTLFDA